VNARRRKQTSGPDCSRRFLLQAITVDQTPWHAATVSHENVEVVDLQIVVDAPTAAVWDAFMNEEERSRWWSYLSLEAHPGGHLIERWRDCRGQPRTTCGQVLQVEAPHRLRCSWRDDDWPESTDVELTLRPAGDATCVRIRHTGWQRLGARGSELCSTHVGGWQLHLANLKRFLERCGS
jgi:uncharacterized protein YndB with AHSA1/START domain